MQVKKFFAYAGLPALLLASSITVAHADIPGIYVGGSWGAYRIDESNLDDNDDLLKAFGGVQLNNWFGIEGSWVDFSRVNNGGSNFNADGKGIAAVFTLPISDTSSVYAKVGQFWWEADSTLGGTVASGDGDDPFFGAGFKIGINKHLALRLEVERYEVSHVDLDTASIGLQVNF